MNDYKFTHDWFSGNIEVWKNHLSEFAELPIKILEVGSHEGRSAVWLCENILLHPDSHIRCVDVFKDRDVFNRFINNISFFNTQEKSKVYWHVGTSRYWLKQDEVKNDQYDIIYIDGDHNAFAALEDAVLAFPLLKVGGVMIFDDYLGGGADFDTLKAPFKGVNAFKDCYADKVQIIHGGYQLIIKKIAE